MKKIKMLVTALVVVTSVGGALAFNSGNFTGNLYCDSKPDSQGGNCSSTQIRYVSDPQSQTSLFCHARAANGTGGPCAETAIPVSQLSK